MGRRREPTDEELRAEQNKEIDDAIEEGKTELNLKTKLQDVAARVGSITTLTRLTLHCPSFPREIGQLTALKSLSIESNEWTSMPEEIGNLVNLESLYAYHNKFPRLPESFGNLVNLRKAVLWQNALTTLPKSIGKLAKLQELEIKWNPMKSWPDEIAALEALEDIDAHSMELTDVPADLSGLRKLHRLVLANNKLKTFPKGLLTLPALVELDLSSNQLAELPEDITRIKTLRELKVKENPLKTLPKTLFSLPLTALNVKQCKLTELPPDVAKPPLIGLDVWANPFKNLPDEIQRLTPSDILKHLGYRQPRVIEGDLPPPDERKAIVAKYKVGFEKFLRGSRNRDRAGKMLAFFQGSANEVPGVAVKDMHEFSASLADVFQPYAAWTFVERRMLAFMAQGWHYKYPGFDYFKGWGEQLYGLLKQQIEEEPKGSTLFSDVARETVAQGVGEDAFLVGALRELDESILRKDDKSPTSFGAYLLEVAPRKLELIADEGKRSSGAGEAIVGLLLRNRKDLFVKIADKFMVLEPSDSGALHAPYELLRQACPVEPARFEKLLFESIDKTDCDHCRAEAGRVLFEAYPQHRAKALDIAKRTLAVISERKNKEERFHFYWSDSENRWEDATAAYIDWCLRTFGKDVHEDVHHLVENTKVFDLETAEVVAQALGQGAIDMLGEGLDMHIEDDDSAAHFRRMFALLAPLDWSKYHDKAWEIARSEHKQVRQTACLALARLGPKAVLPKAKELLASKRGHEREAGTYVLTLVDHPDAKLVLEGLLDTETHDDARDLIAKAKFTGAGCDKAELERRVKSAKARGKLDKPVAKWLDEKKLPKLFLTKSKTPLDPEAVRFLFYRQTRQSEIAIDPEARGPLALVDRAKAGDFARKLLDLVLKNGGVMATNRFALALIGTLGDERVIEPLEELAVEKQNENAARTLGLVGSMEAARALDRILKAYRTKYPNMREAAQEGFDATAERLGLTPFELSDTMIPDFGFQNGRLKIAGTKPELFATLSSERKIALVDKAGQLVKNPKLDAKPKAALKALGEEVRTAQKQLGTNLEYYLIVRRRWNTPAWTTFFDKNPLASAFARGFVWGVYDNGKPKTTFRVTDSGEAVDLGGARVSLPSSGEIGLVHPLEVDAGLRAKWLAEIARAGVTPAFPQLDRPTFAVMDEERARGKCYRFEDQELAGATFKGRAERRGWRRGSVIDSGEVSAYRKVFPHDKVEVFVGTNGLNVQSSFDGGDDVTLKDMFFVRPGAVVTGAYTYDEPHDESDARLIRLSDVPPIVFSEAIADLQAITKRKDEDAEA